uniref:Beta-lactamase-related domain-containing protein n=1 Tax=Branchiostoma floridae TaxID=7739 RepID=C3XUU9_BRAFL|eukprot:XP_002612165.1 hypothetical protein BRAFLDRAFT_88904 [Branchiostoma floridae]
MANFQLVFFFSSTLLVALSPTVITAALEQDLADLDSFIQSLMEYESKPIVGLTISLVKNGDVVFCKGYGKRDLTQGLPVDNRTIFGLGSISKSFTATLLASVLAERDDVTWDTPLVDILGHDFRFQYEFLTKKTTLRDILAHRTGLQRFPTDLLQFGMDIDRAELTRRVRHFSQVHPFRTLFYYNNLLYTLAGHVAERLAGKPFEQLLQERILLPLGVNDTTFLADALEEGDLSNFAQNYATYSWNGGALLVEREKTFRIQKLHAPSGGMASNAVDMARYMQLHLSGGKGPDGRTMVPVDLFRESHTVQFFKPYQPDRELFRPQYPVGVMNNGEGFGLAIGYYRGFRRLYRDGFFTGFSSLISLFPDASGGVFTSLNGPAVPIHVYRDVHSILHYRVADMLLGLEPWLNTTTACSFPQPWSTYNVSYTIPPEPSRDFPRDKRLRNETTRARSVTPYSVTLPFGSTQRIIPSALNKHLADISKHLTDISKHLADISKHLADISKHLADISKHLTDISKHLTDISKHLTDISKHLADISKHLADISKHLADISKHLADIRKKAYFSSTFRQHRCTNREERCMVNA